MQIDYHSTVSQSLQGLDDAIAVAARKCWMKKMPMPGLLDNAGEIS